MNPVSLNILDDIFGLFGQFSDKVYDFVKWLLETLPKSPLAFLKNYQLPSVIQPGLRALNYFVPVSGLLIIANSWLACILIYYVAKILLKWLKAEA